MEIRKNEHKFYVQQCDKEGIVVPGTLKKDLETDFDGLRYIKLTGFESVGKVKNTYSETYADAAYPRLYVPQIPTLESTTLTLQLCFFGEQRYETKRQFHEYIYNIIFRYWDTARVGYAVCTCNETVEISEDNLLSQIPYLMCNFKLTNIFGKAMI